MDLDLGGIVVRNDNYSNWIIVDSYPNNYIWEQQPQRDRKVKPCQTSDASMVFLDLFGWYNNKGLSGHHRCTILDHRTIRWVSRESWTIKSVVSLWMFHANFCDSVSWRVDLWFVEGFTSFSDIDGIPAEFHLLSYQIPPWKELGFLLWIWSRYWKS